MTEPDRIAIEIAKTASAIPFTRILKGSFGGATQDIMKIFGDLEHTLGYDVCCSKYPGQRQGW